MLPLIVLTGNELGGQVLALYKNIHSKLFPYCVNPVFGKTLSEAELPGLEGLYFFVLKKVQVRIIVLAGIECLPPARGLICFFFLINFGYDQNLSKNTHVRKTPHKTPIRRLYAD